MCRYTKYENKYDSMIIFNNCIASNSICRYIYTYILIVND